MAETRSADRLERKVYNFHGRTNNRDCPEFSHDGYISINDLRNALQDDTNVQKIRSDLRKDAVHILDKYLTKNIPEYPNPVEFHISEVTHVTEKNYHDQIVDSEGFKAYGDDDDDDDDKFSWWSLKIDQKSIEAAEERYLEKVFPNRSEEQRERQDEFLNKFTTSPAFHIDESRYGTVRFSFPLNELMETYKKQMCGDQDPVLREYKTMFYKQEIMYVVLVHSPEHNNRFDKFPRIENGDYEGKQIVWKAQENLIVWKAQAIGNDIQFNLILNEEEKIAEVEPVQKQDHYYVWDHVCLAFHFDGVLKFTKEDLEKSFTSCKKTV